jgi:hypothetical protein
MSLLLLLSCIRQECIYNSSDLSKIINNTNNIKLIDFKTNTIFDSIPIKSLPYFDTIDDWNSKNYQSISNYNFTFLKLEKIAKIKQSGTTYKNFKIVCRLDLSDNFFSIIINFQGWETEIFNYLINYSNDFKVIDCIETAYDEIAESSSGSVSTIDKKLINHKYWNYINNKIITKTNIEITESGHFIEKTASK